MRPEIRIKCFLVFILTAANLQGIAQENETIAAITAKTKAVNRDTTLRLVIVSQTKGRQLFARVDSTGRIVFTQESLLVGNRSSYTRCYFDYIYPYFVETSVTYLAKNKSTVPEDAQYYFEYAELIHRQGVIRSKQDTASILRAAAWQYRKAQKKLLTDPFKKLVYDQVLAYPLDESFYHDYEGLEQEKSMFATRGKKGVPLNVKQISAINKAVVDTNSFKAQAATCFNPRMLLVYKKGEKILGSIAICLECNRLEGTGELYLPAVDFNPSVHPEKGCTSCSGMSVKLRHMLNELCKSLNYDSCLNGYDSPYDEVPEDKH